jgi:hypothetical protein
MHHTCYLHVSQPGGGSIYREGIFPEMIDTKSNLGKDVQVFFD